MKFDVTTSYAVIFHVQTFNVVTFHDTIIFQIFIVEYVEEKTEKLILRSIQIKKVVELCQNYLRRIYMYFLFFWSN